MASQGLPGSCVISAAWRLSCLSLVNSKTGMGSGKVVKATRQQTHLLWPSGESFHRPAEGQGWADEQKTPVLGRKDQGCTVTSPGS